MRRQEREVTDIQLIDEIIASCECCRIGLLDGNKPYIVPLNFGFQRVEGKAIFYFHGANEGKKVGLIQKNAYAGFELDTNHSLVTAKEACGHSFKYQSIIGNGKISMVEDKEEKIKALGIIMMHYTKKSDWVFPENMLERVGVIKLEVEELTCKEHK